MRSHHPVRLPPAGAKFDYQLGGAYRLPPGVTVVTRDRLAAPASGVYNICYINAFQTQPGQLPWWRAHHRALLLRDRGAPRARPGLARRGTARCLERVEAVPDADVIGRWIDRCAARRLRRSRARQLRLVHPLAAPAHAVRGPRTGEPCSQPRAHRAGLAIAQKNLAPLTRSQRKTVGFDFAVSEECGVWHECSSYRAAYGRHVIEIEYTDNGRRAFARSCRDHGDAWSVVLRDRMLVTPSSRHYVYRAC